MAMTAEEMLDLSRRFTYLEPDETRTIIHEALRMRAHSMAYSIVTNAPPCRERSLAITKIEEALMWANAALARGGKNGTNRD
ncbi:MAG: hypothetical protein KAJ06_00810 [Gammaproteobacteria bacterium]|nr:hypothetical protein [Gammaproteobacteria bacterium]